MAEKPIGEWKKARRFGSYAATKPGLILPSRHTTVEITSAEIKNLSSALEQARDAMSEWQTSHSKWGLDWDEPDNHYMALAGVLGAIESVRALEKQLFKQHRKQINQPDKESFIQRVKDALAPKEITHQPTSAELRELDRDLAKGSADALEHKAVLQPTVAALREFSGEQHRSNEVQQPGENVGKISDWLAQRELNAQRKFETQLDRDLDKQLDKADAIGRAHGVQHQPTVAELGKEFSDRQRFGIDILPSAIPRDFAEKMADIRDKALGIERAPLAIPETVREIERDDGMEMG